MRVLKRVIATALAAGLLGFPFAGGAAAADETPAATLTVTGHGEVSRAPDLATVGAAIVTNDPNASRALSENNRRYTALIAKLGAAGIGPSDITSTSLQSYFSPKPAATVPGEPGALYGFIVTRNIGIAIAALGQTGAVIDAATAAGATQINGVTYDFRDRRGVERAALAAAVGDAYAQAVVIASAAHVQIVRVLRIGDGATPGRALPMAMSMARAAEAPVPTTITPSNLDIASSVTVTYVIR